MASDWHPEDIKAAIRKAGGTLAGIARASGIKKQTLSACLVARASERGDLAIARFIGIPAKNIWPTRYDRQGNRVRFVHRVSDRVAA